MNPLAWLDESFSLPFAQTLGHFLWQGTLIAVAARGIEQCYPNATARAKYLLYLAALVAMVGCPPMTFTLMGAAKKTVQEAADNGRPVPREIRSHGAVADTLTYERPESSPAPGGKLPPVTNASAMSGDADAHDTSTTLLLNDEIAPKLAGTGAALPDEAPEGSDALIPLLAQWVTRAYLVSVLVLLARLAAGLWGGHKLRATAVTVTDADLLAAVARHAKRLGMRAAPAVAYCRSISVPVVVGVLRPMILLPAALASGLAPHQLEALLLHELAHLRRWDPLVNLLQRLAEALLFFHPAVWYVSRRVHTERENASDDMVLAAGWQRVQYADALVHMAELANALRRRKPVPHATALAASGGSPSEFKRRVTRLLDPEPRHYRLSNTGWMIFLLIVVCAAAAPLAVRTWAEQAPSDASDKVQSATRNDGRLGRRIEHFRLQDYLGAAHSLSDFDDRALVLVAFLGVECPLATLYAPRLQNLAERYKSRSVAVIGIDSNQQDTPTELAQFARRHGIAFPLLKDPGNRVADQFGAERTPEVFVLDRDRRVRYWGRIDDQFGVGYVRSEAKQTYVASAIDELLAGRPVSVAHTDSTGCHIGRVSRAAPTGDITYTKQISRIVQRRCVECHRQGGIAPFTLDSYDSVAAWAETIREVVDDGRMPPWHASPKYSRFANSGRMPEAEKQLLDQWVANGVPRGVETDLPPPHEFVDGWALGTPDLVLTMPQPVAVPATGVVEYQYVTVDPGFSEGKWIRASEIHPGVRSVVHHLVVFINPPGGDPILKKRGVGFEMVGGYVPGAPPMQLTEGVARYVPPGSTFVLQIHYTPDGVERQDQSQVGLYFADPATVRRAMQTGVAANLDFEIPPRADNFAVEASHRFSHDMELHALAPHMHFRGKSFRAEAVYPNGSREILLDVPRYDFNWQNNYRFDQPKFMPEGTVLHCVGHFDNSEDNLANPDPTVAVRWGEQTWEEMMIGYFEGVFLNQDLSLPAPRITSTRNGMYLAHFTYRPDRPAERVNLAGTFNQWSNSSHPMTDADGDGVFEAEVTLAPGGYRYKFVIDGDYWTHDPASRILTGFLHESFFVAGSELAERSPE